MGCINCDSENSAVILVETLPCKHCGGEVNVEYNVCKDCGLAWKTVDGEIVESTTFFDMGLEDLFEDDEEWMKEFDMVLNTNEVLQSSHMSDYIHKCLKCQKTCYEVAENRWQCPGCGFTWEVIKTGD